MKHRWLDICLSPYRHCLHSNGFVKRVTWLKYQGKTIFYCNDHKVANACVLIRILKGCSHSPNGPIDMIMKSKWIEVVVDTNEEAFPKLLHDNHIQLIKKLSDINIHDSFSLSPIKTSSNMHNCNMIRTH